MTGEAGAPGTAGDGFRVTKPEGRHRAPPLPPKPWLPQPTKANTATLLAAAAVITLAGLLAIAGQAVAPDASAAASTTTAPTAAHTARTVSVPLEILPAPVPTIGAEGAWDPETEASVENPLSRPVPSQNFAGATGTVEVPEALSDELVATTDSSTTETPAPTAAATTTAPPAGTTAAATTTSSATTTEEQPVPTETAEPTTDIGDLIDQIVEDALGEGS